MTKTKGVYIHIPFCHSKCHYCDFTSFPKNETKQEEYLDYLKKEIKMYPGEDLIDSIYIGGGTPSILYEEQIQGIMETLGSRFQVESLETTMEFNPEDVKERNISKLLRCGINRISLGVQSFCKNLLKSMGRNHDDKDIVDAVQRLRDHGVQNISFDLIFGYPGQRMEDIKEDLNWIHRLQPDHISWYNLILEKSTKLYRQWEKGLVLPGEEEEIKMYEEILKGLSQLGYEQYEISNFSKKGKESVHNLKYWHYEDYYGFGIGASGSLYPKRWRNTSSYREYKKLMDQGEFPYKEMEELTREEMAFEYIIMNMRLTKGMSLEKYTNRFHRDFYKDNERVIQEWVNSNHLRMDQDHIKFTKKGFEISNYILTKFK